ncbi:MAG: prolipoprotein diacylglyceryl transferase family protein [Galactobacter sp.]
MFPAAIPSANSEVLTVGPLTLHGFTLCVVLGIVVGLIAATVGARRRGLPLDLPLSALLWSAPLAVVGGRFQALLQDPGVFFGTDGDPARLLSLSIGGLGAWGALAGGIVGLLLCARSRQFRFGEVADAVAAPTLLAVGIAVWGQWFSAERFGSVTTKPWGWDVGDAALVVAGLPVGSTVEPIFLGQSLWMLLGAVAMTVIFRGSRPKARGNVALVSLAWLGMGYGAASWLRQDVPADAGVALPGAAAGLTLACAALVWAVIRALRSRNRFQELEISQDQAAVPEPEPDHEPELDHKPESEPEPESAFGPEPSDESAPEASEEAAPGPSDESATEPSEEAAPEQVAESAPEPLADPVATSAEEAAAAEDPAAVEEAAAAEDPAVVPSPTATADESVTAAGTEPVAEPLTEPLTVVEPVVEEFSADAGADDSLYPTADDVAEAEDLAEAGSQNTASNAPEVPDDEPRITGRRRQESASDTPEGTD